MRILHIINNLDGGGAEKLMVELASFQNKRHEVSILALKKSNLTVYADWLKNENIPLRILKANKKYSLASINELIEILGTGDFDIIHSHLFPSQYYLAIVKWFFLAKTKTRFVTTEHSTSNTRRKYWIFKPFERWVYSTYDATVCISKNAEEELRKHLGVYGDRILTINNGIDIDRYNNALPANIREIFPEAGPDLKVIIMVGRFVKAKDHETLIKAMTLVPANVRLLLVGEGEKKKEIEGLSAKLMLGDRVCFSGFRKDIPELLKSVDIAVLSSHYEGLPLAALESMAAGRAIVASNVRGITDVVKGAGILFENGDHETLANIIMRLFAKEDLLKRVEQRCIERAQLYGIENMVDQYIEVYNNILKRN